MGTAHHSLWSSNRKKVGGGAVKIMAIYLIWPGSQWPAEVNQLAPGSKCVVSGDFKWSHRRRQVAFIGVAPCPGASLSTTALQPPGCLTFLPQCTHAMAKQMVFGGASRAAGARASWRYALAWLVWPGLARETDKQVARQFYSMPFAFGERRHGGEGYNLSPSRAGGGALRWLP